MMFLSYFSVKIGKNSETSKTEKLCEELCNWMHWETVNILLVTMLIVWLMNICVKGLIVWCSSDNFQVLIIQLCHHE